MTGTREAIWPQRPVELVPPPPQRLVDRTGKEKEAWPASFSCNACTRGITGAVKVAAGSRHRRGGGQLGEQFVGLHAVFEAGGEEDVAHVIGGEPAQFGQPLLLREAMVR